MQTAEAAATRAARDGSIATACRAIPKKDKAVSTKRNKVNNHISDGRKSATAWYLQLKSGQAVTGVHLLITYKKQDFECWYCKQQQTRRCSRPSPMPHKEECEMPC